MSLERGARIAHYEILGLLGRGGMGEVYRATDTKLNRDVALKFLPEQFTLDSNRMERFQREAKLLASVNHSNIATIYGIEESDQMRALVIELVAGARPRTPKHRNSTKLRSSLISPTNCTKLRPRSE